MAKRKAATNDVPETKAERQERLLSRDHIDISRREEREVVGVERRLDALTADWE